MSALTQCCGTLACWGILAVLTGSTLLSVSAAASPRDIVGWRETRWGMTEEALVERFGPRLVRLPAPRRYARAYASRMLSSAQFAGQQVRVFFQMSRAEDRLQQVLLEPVNRTNPEKSFRIMLVALRDAYGPPHKQCADRAGMKAPRSNEYIWRYPTTTIHLVVFDFYTSAIAFEDPNADPKLPAPRVKTQRNNPRFLPRRALVRFHPANRIDLMSPACRF